MLRFYHMLSSAHVSQDPVALLWHYLCGHMVNWVNGESGPVRFNTGGHRGVQYLDKVQFPRKQKRYIFAPQFEIRYNTAFEEVVRGCADPTREGKTWISEELIRALVALNKMGFAHSYEAWTDGKLGGGGFGVQLGSMISCDSMFHRVSNASKAAYGQTLLHLQKRGFRLVDTNGVAEHQVNYGEEWLPRWKFEQETFACLKESPSLTDDRPYPPLPWEVRALLPGLRPMRRIVRKLPWVKEPQDPHPASEPAGAAYVAKSSAAVDVSTTPAKNEPPRIDDTPASIS
jgi:leucyl/phenylalanyl-tRNA--protein transferase